MNPARSNLPRSADVFVRELSWFRDRADEGVRAPARAVRGLRMIRQQAFALFLLSAALPWPALAQTQPRVDKGFSMPHYAQNNLIDAICTGSSAAPQNGRLRVTDFELKTFRDGVGKQPQLIAQGPLCFIESKTHVLDGDGPIQLYTPSTNIFIQGTGFRCEQTNSLLVISNDVRTRLLRALVRSPSATTNTFLGNVGQIVQITSDHFQLRYDLNVATYIGHVHLLDERMDLTCDTMTADYSSNGVINHIVAEGHVTITITNHGVATGDKAVYRLERDSEQIDLTGLATWHDAERELSGDALTFDRASNVVIADRHGHLHVRSFGQGGFAGPAAASSPARTNAPLDLFAGNIRLELPPDGSSVTRIHALGEVLATNVVDHSGLTGQEADYSATNDLVQIVGRPTWQDDRMQVTADGLFMGQTNRYFQARGHAHSIWELGGFAGAGSGPTARSSLVIFVDADLIDARSNQVNFTTNVQAELKQGTNLLWTLSAEQLRLKFGSTNQLESAVAQGQPELRKAPDARVADGVLDGDILTALFDPTGTQVKTLHAEGHAFAREAGPGAKPWRRDLSATSLTAYLAASNEVERIEAEQNVIGHWVRPGYDSTNEVTGQHATYRLIPGDSAEITGHPEAKTDSVLLQDADILLWDGRTDNFQATGPYKATLLKAGKKASSR